MQYPAVTMAIRRFAKRLETNRDLARKIKRLKKMLLIKDVTLSSRPFHRLHERAEGSPIPGRIDVPADEASSS
jgi:hypothetical protein